MNNQIIKGSLADIAQKENMSISESFLNADILILLDNSGSMCMNDAPNGMTRQQAAEKELRTLQNKYRGKIALICFADDVIPSPSGVILECGSTTDMAAILRYALQFDNIGMKIVIVTDGEPNNEKDTLEVAKKFKQSIDAIFIGREGGRGMDFLNRLINLTGGKAFDSEKPGMFFKDVEKILLLG